MAENIWIMGVPIIALLIVAIGTYALWRTIKEKKSGFPLNDERTIKIQGKTATAAFTLSTWYLLLINFYNMYRIQLQGLPELGSMPVINSTVILMGVTYIVLYTYFSRKEDA